MAFSSLSSLFENAGADGAEPLHVTRSIVESAQRLMGLSVDSAPTGTSVAVVEHPIESLESTLLRERGAVAGASIDDGAWNKILGAVSTDALVFLGAVVVVVPLFVSLNQSPVTGFLVAGALLSSFGLFKDNREISAICQLGIEFLLFEMGLELSSSRLKALAKYAFGLGLGQVVLTTLFFSLLLLPVGDAVGTKVLELIQPEAASGALEIRSVLEAIVIGFALSLSSSAFTLQMLEDKKVMGTRFGAATLGVLLFQDVSVVPFVVLLPVVQTALAIPGPESARLLGSPETLKLLGAGLATQLLDLGVLAVCGRQLVLTMFRIIAPPESEEPPRQDVMLAMSLLTVVSFSQAAAALGYSETLGAFLAGIVIADSVYAHKIIDTLKPLKSLFLSLFFVTVGSTIDLPLVAELWPVVVFMALALMVGKVGVLAAIAPLVGLTFAEGVVAGASLSQGGEFAFVILGQAAAGESGNILPPTLDKILVAVVVLSMALTSFGVDAAVDLLKPDFDCDDDECEAAKEMEARGVNAVPPERALPGDGDDRQNPTEGEVVVVVGEDEELE